VTTVGSTDPIARRGAERPLPPSRAFGDKLVHSVNQISAFFEGQPRSNPADAVRDHLLSYWDPWVRSELIRHVEAGAGDLRAPAPGCDRARGRGSRPGLGLTSEMPPPPFVPAARSASSSGDGGGWLGIGADVDQSPRLAVPVPEQFLGLSGARRRTVVAGAYGHSRPREWVFSGVTEWLLAACPVPVLFSR
jgi:hypothetical protein